MISFFAEYTDAKKTSRKKEHIRQC